MVRSRRNVPRVPAELQVVDLSLVGSTSEHKRARWVLRVYFPDADESALLTRSRQQISMPIQSHRGN